MINNLNNNFNKNNNMNLMGNNPIIHNILENNRILYMLIINYIQQNNYNNPINNNLFQTINNLIQINNNFPNNFNQMYLMEMKQKIFSLVVNLNQMGNNNKNQMDNNNMNQLNNNNNQINNYLKPIIISLNQIYNNINNMMNLFNNNCCQIDKSNNFYNNKDTNNKINKNDNKNINKDNTYDSFFKEYKDYFPLIGLKNVGPINYINSILQCLLHIPQLNGFFINKYPEQKDLLKKINKDAETVGRLCEEYFEIVMGIYKQQDQKKSYIAPKSFIHFLSKINGQLEKIDAKDFYFL